MKDAKPQHQNTGQHDPIVPDFTTLNGAALKQYLGNLKHQLP